VRVYALLVTLGLGVLACATVPDGPTTSYRDALERTQANLAAIRSDVLDATAGSPTRQKRSIALLDATGVLISATLGSQ